MKTLIVGNVLKDVYLNLDTRTENLETDRNNIKWLNLGFNSEKHYYHNRNSSYGGAAVSLEVLTKFGQEAEISDSGFSYEPDGPHQTKPVAAYRYILIADEAVSYFGPTDFPQTPFSVPTDAYDYLYIDRSATLTVETANKILTYLDISRKTKLILYVKDQKDPAIKRLLPSASLIFLEESPLFSEKSSALPSNLISSTFSSTKAPDSISPDSSKIVRLSEHAIVCQNISEPLSLNRINTFTHLSIYSIASATVLASFMLGDSIEESLRLARLNLENSKLNSTLSKDQLQALPAEQPSVNDPELIAKSLLVPRKGILAADESGGSIHKKFNQLNIPDTYDNRRNYRNLFFTTDGLEKYVSGVILFDETARQTADDGQNFVDYLTGKRIIPGIKVDQGLTPLKPNSPETITKGLDGLAERLKEYYEMGLRFAKWRAAFEIRLGEHGNLLTPTDEAITKNCQILAEYARKCQDANIVPIVEPEVVYDGYYSIEKSAEITGKILDKLFEELNNIGVNLRACILKVNMVIAGKNFESPSSSEEVGKQTAEVLKAHVPKNLAGVVFLSGGQTPEQATENLASVIKNGPFPWPVTFSFARALQDPTLFAWAGDNNNNDKARQAFADRLRDNQKALDN
ncbi:fructose-bisphosphate aldolase class I [Candidatus Saccharibacteria bacterium]|nr:fructose-bisphosphate aldolase class I [Candidatus Saccharibacteria bacterium]